MRGLLGSGGRKGLLLDILMVLAGSVLVALAVAGIQDRDIDVFQFAVIGILGVPDHHGIIADGLQNLDCIVEGFTLCNGTLADIDVRRRRPAPRLQQ